MFSNASTAPQLPISKLISIPDKTTAWAILFLLIISHYTINLIRTLLKKQRFESFTSIHKCFPVRHAANPFPMPWSLNRKYEVYKASVRGDLFEGHFTRQYVELRIQDCSADVYLTRFIDMPSMAIRTPLSPLLRGLKRALILLSQPTSSTQDPIPSHSKCDISYFKEQDTRKSRT